MSRTRTTLYMPARRVAYGLTLSLVAGALGASSCGLLAGVDFDAVTPRGEGGAGGASSASSASMSSASTGTGGSGTGGSGTGGAPEAPCDPNEQPNFGGVYVSPTGDAMGIGSDKMPFQTIAKALSASQPYKVIYLDKGVYPEAVSISDNYIIDGSWSRTEDGWKRLCDSHPSTTIMSPTAVAVSVGAQKNVVARLSNLIVYTKSAAVTPSNQDGESHVGIFVHENTELTLFNVEVHATDAGHGGMADPVSSAGPATCSGTDDCSPGEQSDPASGMPGKPGTEGTFGPNGFTPGAATVGSMGDPGDNGVIGSPGSLGNNCYTGCVSPMMCDATLQSTLMGGTGTCGCGGVGGTGGNPGRAGGASLGIFAYGAGATVTINYSSIEAGLGGPGSAGSEGAMDTSATLGQIGTPSLCHQGACVSSATSCDYDDTKASVKIGGMEGTAGVPGGQGGKGGGGSGGPSYGVVSGDGATISRLGGSITAAGGGPGGGDAPNVGAKGGSGPTLELP